MTVLFAAGELESFDGAASANVSSINTGGRYDSDFARSAIKVTGDAFVGADFSDTLDGWLHLEMYDPVIPENALDFAVIQLIDTGTGQVVVTVEADNGAAFGMEYWNGSSFTKVFFSSDLTDDTLHVIDIHWKIANSGGDFTVYVDGTEQATFAGDTLLSGFTTINRFRLLGGDNIGHATVPEMNFSQVIVATEDTRGWHLATLDPIGASGTNTAWTGNHLDVDDIGLTDGSDVESTSANDVETFTLTNLSATAATFDVVAMTIGFRGQNAVTGPQNIQAALRTNSLNFFSASVSGLGTSYSPFNEVFTNNPDTAALWTTSAIDALEVGVKSIA